MKLWEPTKCCCCCNTRTGTLVIGYIFLIGGILNIIFDVMQFINGSEDHPEVFDEICNLRPEEENCEEDMKAYMETYKKFEYGSAIYALIFSCFHVIFSSLLLHGVYKQKTSFFIPLMIMYAIQIGVLILASLAIVIIFMYEGIGAAAVVFAAIMGGAIFLETYCLLVIRAYYLEMKRTKGQIHMTLNETDQEGSSYPALPQQSPYPAYNVSPPPYSDAAPPYPQNPNNAHLYPSIEKEPK